MVTSLNLNVSVVILFQETLPINLLNYILYNYGCFCQRKRLSKSFVFDRQGCQKNIQGQRQRWEVVTL